MTKCWQAFLFVLISMVGLWGCTSIQPETLYKVSVNGLDIKRAFQVLYRGDAIFVSASLLDEVGAVVSVQQEELCILLAIEDHLVSHVVGTGELYIDGRAITLSPSSFLEDGIVYIPLSFVEAILATRVSVTIVEPHVVHVDLAISDMSQRLRKLNEMKETTYFYPEHLFRYAEHFKKHTDLNVHEAVIYVNAKLDEPFYSNIKVISHPEDILVLCNKNNCFSDNYEPHDLVDVGEGHFLRREAAEAYQEMMQAADQRNLSFQLRSAYRSYETQRYIYDSQVIREGKVRADTYSARPGHSEHQSGLAIDIIQPLFYGTLISADFEQTPQYAWISRNAHKYGFIMRYPKNKIAITGYHYEPWQYRYVGREVAKHIYERGLTLEEYLALSTAKILNLCFITELSL